MMLMGRNALYYEDYVLAIRRFNMVITAKPYLPEPYFYRALAKFYLEDHIGAISDLDAAIDRNPFIPDNYKLRAICRINIKRYNSAISDYEQLLQIEPKDESALHNLSLCYMQVEDYEHAETTINRMQYFWPQKAEVYTLSAQINLQRKDTISAIEDIEKALNINAYDGLAWNMRAAIHAAHEEYKEAEEALDKTILQMPFQSGHYVNRALMRYHQRNLRGAMADYDTAIELDSTSYIAHFNRGLLRAQVGEDNLAIEDFNHVLNIDSQNTIARYNRALLLSETGDYNGALADINAVLLDFPDFLAGYSFRADVYRKIGKINAAEEDEFHVMKTQIDRRYGNTTQKQSDKPTRKISEHNIEDYDKLITANDDEDAPTYESDYRGKVQNRKTELAPMPALSITYYTSPDAPRTVEPLTELEKINNSTTLPRKLYLTHYVAALDEEHIKEHFTSIQELSQKIEQNSNNDKLRFARAIDEYIVQDFERAMSDIDKAIEIDSTNILYLQLRIQIRIKDLEVRTAAATNNTTTNNTIERTFDTSRTEYAAAINDCNHLEKACPQFAGVYYNLALILIQTSAFTEAIEMLNKAIALNPDYAEAYYNRAIAAILSGDPSTAVKDLSRAGELGLYKAYNLIKRYKERK